MACPMAAKQNHDWRMRATRSFFFVVTPLGAGLAWLIELRHASLSRLLYQNHLVAAPMPLVRLGTHRMLVNHLADKCTRLAADRVLAQSASGGEVVEVRMPLHLFECLGVIVLLERDSEECLCAHGSPRGGWFRLACRLRSSRPVRTEQRGILQDNVFRPPACLVGTQAGLVACLQAATGRMGGPICSASSACICPPVCSRSWIDWKASTNRPIFSASAAARKISSGSFLKSLT